MIRLTDQSTATQLAADIASGKLSIVEATEAAIARIDELNEPINAVVVRDFDAARVRAKWLDETGPNENQPLFGVPATISRSRMR